MLPIDLTGRKPLPTNTMKLSKHSVKFAIAPIAPTAPTDEFSEAIVPSQVFIEVSKNYKSFTPSQVFVPKTPNPVAIWLYELDTNIKANIVLMPIFAGVISALFAFPGSPTQPKTVRTLPATTQTATIKAPRYQVGGMPDKAPVKTSSVIIDPSKIKF